MDSRMYFLRSGPVLFHLCLFLFLINVIPISVTSESPRNSEQQKEDRSILEGKNTVQYKLLNDINLSPQVNSVNKNNNNIPRSGRSRNAANIDSEPQNRLYIKSTESDIILQEESSSIASDHLDRDSNSKKVRVTELSPEKTTT